MSKPGEDEGESKSDSQAEGKLHDLREKRAKQSAMAIRILNGMTDTSVGATKLAAAIIRELEPDMFGDDPALFNEERKALADYLRKLPRNNSLWESHVDETDPETAFPKSYRNPNHRGRRATKPSQKAPLNYSLTEGEAE